MFVYIHEAFFWLLGRGVLRFTSYPPKFVHRNMLTCLRQLPTLCAIKGATSQSLSRLPSYSQPLHFVVGTSSPSFPLDARV